MKRRRGQRQRVLLCVDEFKAGGVTIVMLDLARVLRGTVDVEFAALRSGPWLSRMRETGLPITIASPARMIRLMRRFDLIHSHHRSLGVLALAAGVRSRSIEHVHNLFSDRPLLSFRGRQVVAVSAAVAESLQQHYPHLRRRSIAVVRNAAPPALLAMPHPRARPTPLVAVAVGRLDEQKDPLTFLELARALHDIDPEFRATWVGDGPLEHEFRSRLLELGLGDVVVWEEMPPRERTVQLIADAGVAVLTSRWEGFPMVVLEAAALGTPIAITECGDITAEVDRLGMGVVMRGERTAPRVVQGWAAAIHDMWAGEARWLDVSDRAKRAAREEFSMDRLRSEMLDVYRDVLPADRRASLR